MKKLAMVSLLSLLFVGVSLLSLSVLVAPASAQGIPIVHGHNGHVEYQDRIDTDLSPRPYIAWGLDFYQKSGFWNWIHYSIPTEVNSKTRFLGIKFETGSADIFINQVHVYDGRTLIYDSPTLGLSGPTYKDTWYIIDMGSDKLIDQALGLSIEIGAGVEAMDHRILIYAVGAEWHW